jgi:ribosomal protein S18 acetylase RimI-like enzyme
MFIARATAPTEELLNALHRLIPQLKANFRLPSVNDLVSLLSAGTSLLYIARYPDTSAPIAGILTLVLYRVPTGIRARVEDVIVDEDFRGQGIGEALIRHAIRVAQDCGADGVALTCNPNRLAANKLYQKIGFSRWDTNLYYYKL